MVAEKAVSPYILEGPSPIYQPAPGGVGYEIFRCLKLHKDKIFEYIIDTGETETYHDLLQKSIRAALYLSKKNLKKDDIVCYCGGNRKDSFVPFVAAQFAGVNYVSLEPMMVEEDLIYILDHLKPKVIFVTKEAQDKMELCLKKTKLKADVMIYGNSAKFDNFCDLIVTSVEEENNFKPVFIEDIKETCIIFMSSGTTGKPKGICCNHYALLFQSFQTIDRSVRRGTVNLNNFVLKYDDKEAPTFMFFSPVYWITGVLWSLGVISNGGSRVVSKGFDPEKVWYTLEKYEIDTAFLPPGQLVELNSYAWNKKPNTKLGACMTAGAMIMKKHIEIMKNLFPNTKNFQMLGMTETVGWVTSPDVWDPEEKKLQEKHPESCGKPGYGVKVKIVDVEDETLCGPGKKGELRLASHTIMNGYYKIDNSSAFDSDGWFKTGDLAFYDENGFIYIVDRIKDILRYSDYDISPSVIEKILFQHPAVYECFVTGQPHPKDNEHAMGVVVLKEKFKGKVSQDELVAYVNERVPYDQYKLRAGIKFLDRMLKTANGKLRKIEMKPLVLNKI